LNKGHIKMLT